MSCRTTSALVPALVCFTILSACASLSTIPPREAVIVPMDDRGWTIGYSAQQNSQTIAEFVLPGESVHDWTELVTVQTFFGAQKRFTPEQLMRGQKQETMEGCPTAMWKVIRTSDNDVLYEWRTMDCQGWDDQHEISMYIRGDEALHSVRYTNRTPEIADQLRADWIARVGRAKIQTASQISQASVSSVTASCKKPYELSQDCSVWSGAKREVEIEGFAVRIAGSSDGKIVLVMDKNWPFDLLETGIRFKTVDEVSVAKSTSFDVIKNTLIEDGIKIVDVIPMSSLGDIDGYFLLLESDGYTLLKRYSED